MNLNNHTHQRKKIILSVSSVLLVMAASFLIYFIPGPTTIQLYETAPGQYQTIEITPEITIDLDGASSVAVKKSQPIQVELLRGEVYFVVHAAQKNSDQLEVILGNARIKHIGTRFVIRMEKNGGIIAVSEGQVELQIGNLNRVIGAGKQISFNATTIIGEASITATDIAPWRQRHQK